MACFLPSTLDNPLAEAMELTRTAPAQVAAVAIGALVGVALFAIALALFSRRRRRPAFDALAFGTANDVVFIPPYPTALQSPRRPALETSHVPQNEPQVFVRSSFTPSTALSARVFAKMGYPFAGEEEPQRVANLQEIEELASSEVCALETGSIARVLETAPMSPVPAPIDSIPCVLESLPALSSIETGPMSAVTIGRIVSIDAADESPRRPSSSVMRAASIADLDLDDAPTELREPLFDAPQPRLRVTPPKIRPVTPTPPRAAAQLSPAPKRGMLPQRELGLRSNCPN